MSRRLLAWVILGSWFASLSWLTFRERKDALDPFGRGDVSLLPTVTHFYALRSGRTQVGIASITIDTTADGFRLTERFGIDLPRGADSGRASLLANYELTEDLRLVSYRITLPAPGGDFPITGIMEGDSLLRVVAGDSATAETWLLPMASRPVPLVAAPLWLAARGGLQPGLKTSLPVFDPVGLVMDTLHYLTGPERTLAVVDSAEFDEDAGLWKPAMRDSVKTWEVSREHRDGMVLLDRYGLPVRTHNLAGLNWSRSAFEMVNTNYMHRRGRDPVILSDQSVVLATLLEAGVTAGGSRRDTLVAQFNSRPDRAGAPDSAASRQGWNGTHLVVRSDTLPGQASLPDSAGRVALAAWLRDEPWIQSEDSLVRSLSAIASGRGGSAITVARRLTRWVHNRIRPATSGPISARRALELGRGDADAQALALTALARASGIPARPVSGLLLADDRFYLHSWVEVHLGEWVEVDPALGQFPVDARHIRLLTGGRARLDIMHPMVAGVRLWLTPTSGPI